MQAYAPHGVEGAQALHHHGLGLLDYLDVGGDDQQDEYHDQDRDDPG